MKSDLMDIEVVVHRDNDADRAVLVSTEVSSPRRVWVPRSLATLSDQEHAPSKRAILTGPEWFFLKEGLI